ncbi:MAG: YcdB/YcdC domain-containing protein [Clostridium sp.]
MKIGKRAFLTGTILISLLLMIVLIATTIILSKNKDIRTAKAFIESLNDKGIIESKENIDEIEFLRVEGKINDKGKYITLASKEYGVDIDDEYEVVGFFNKSMQAGDVKISKEQSVDIANKYLPILYSGEAKFKKINEDGEKEAPFYTIVFSKYENGYPFYNDEITISVDKTTGKLTGFTNISVQGDIKESKVSLTKESANNIALEKFNSMYKNGEMQGESNLVYASNKEKNNQSYLCYNVLIKGKDEEGKNDVYYTYFISANSGEVIDSFRDSDKIINQNK